MNQKFRLKEQPVRKLATYVGVVAGAYLLLSLIYLALAWVVTRDEPQNFNRAWEFLVLIWILLLFPFVIFTGILFIDIAVNSISSEAKIVKVAEVFVGLSAVYVLCVLVVLIIYGLWFLVRVSYPLVFYSFIAGIIFCGYYFYATHRR